MNQFTAVSQFVGARGCNENFVKIAIKFTIIGINSDQCTKIFERWETKNSIDYLVSNTLLFENPKENFSNLFPSIMKVLKGKQKKLFIYGNNWPTKDGTCIRDFIHVMDLAEAHIAALNYLICNDPQIISLNIGTGKGTSILELIKTFSSIYKKDFPYEFADKRLGDKAYIVANNRKALDLLDWLPRRTLFDICNDYVYL